MACYVAGGIEICEAGGSFEVEGGNWSAQDGEGEGEEEEERDGGGVHVFFWGGGFFGWLLVEFSVVRGVEEVGGEVCDVCCEGGRDCSRGIGGKWMKMMGKNNQERKKNFYESVTRKKYNRGEGIEQR